MPMLGITQFCALTLLDYSTHLILNISMEKCQYRQTGIAIGMTGKRVCAQERTHVSQVVAPIIVKTGLMMVTQMLIVDIRHIEERPVIITKEFNAYTILKGIW